MSQEIPVRFYRTTAGTEPVLEWLRRLEKARSSGDWPRLNARAIRLAHWDAAGAKSQRWAMGEIRSTLPSERIARLILCFHQGTLVVLHGFIKKAQKTPQEDLALAKRRMKEVTR